jgi:predicted metalloprotease with PDZ domain
VPEGVKEVEVTFDLLLAAGAEGGAQFMTVASPKVMTLNWNDVQFYPKCEKPRALEFAPSVTLPQGWKCGTALSRAGEEGGRCHFVGVALETLIDSPLLAGDHGREIPVAAGGDHRVVMACDSPDGLEVPEVTLAAWKKLPAEAAAIFGGSRPYARYTFLLGLSNGVPRAGIEHHQSSDNRLGELALVKAGERKAAATLLPHEFAHAWNGKYRRPADMVVPDYQVPQQTRLLWVYEGLTNYLGWVLAARCGLLAAEEARDYLAMTAARMASTRGRNWRPLDDTAAAASTLFDATRSWRSARRAVDFYDEGTLLWLEVDVMIRAQTKGAKSLDDFCKLFFAGGANAPAVKGYRPDDVLAALNEVAPRDWKSHFRRRVEVVAESPPLGGITGGGWELRYAEKPTELFVTVEALSKGVSLLDSAGFAVGGDGLVGDVVPDSPAAKAGLAPGMKLLAVNGRRLTPEGLKGAVAATKSGGKLELLAESGDFFKTHSLDYKGGARYPRLERKGGAPDLLAEVVKPAPARK